MTTILGKRHAVGQAIADYLDRNPDTNLSTLARQCRRDESTLRAWLNERSEPAYETLVEISPFLPDDLVRFLMDRLGGGRFVAEPIEPSGHVPFCVVTDSIELIRDAADASRRAAEYGGDSFVTNDEAAQLDGYCVRIIRRVKAYRVGLRSIAGRSVRVLTRGRL